jgi:hypothetical protein
MLRQLLTLLAVITGLGLSAQPAVAAEVSVVTVAASGQSETCQPIVARPLMLATGAASRTSQARPCRPAPVVVITPTVQLQADRARE